MHIVFYILLTIWLGANSVVAQEQIENSAYKCVQSDTGNSLTKTNKKGAVTAVPFSKEVKKLKRKTKQLNKKKKATSNKKVRSKIAKKLKAQRAILSGIKECQNNSPKREAASYEQVMTDCTGDFDISSTESPVSFVVNGAIAIMRGVITGKIVSKVKSLIESNPQLRTIVIAHSPGSDNDEKNVVAGRLVNKAKLATCVPKNASIASGAVDFFLAGTTRYLGENSFVGTHSWVDNNGVEGADLPMSDSGHKLFLNYFEDIGINTGFYWFTINSAPANGIHNMTTAERTQWGMETKP